MADKKTLEYEIKLIAQSAAKDLKNMGVQFRQLADDAKHVSQNMKKDSATFTTLESAAKKAAASFKLFGTSSSELKALQNQLKSGAVDLVAQGFKPESKEVQSLVSRYKELGDEAERLSKKEQRLAGESTTLSDVIRTLQNEVGSLVAVAAAVKIDTMIADAAGKALSLSTSFQAAKDDFGIMLGDMKAGSAFFEELHQFNFWTPFDIEQTSQAAKVLLAAKVPLADITEYLTRFGDIAQGNAQRFQSFITAFSKASAKGKADMEVLNVFVDQGVQIFDALASQCGTTADKIADLSSKGKISFKDLDEALRAMASEGGQYFGTLETAAMRLDAVQAGLTESAKALAASYGDMLAPSTSKVLTIVTDLIDKVNESPILKGVLLGVITALAAAINILALVAIKALIAKLAATTLGATAATAAVTALKAAIGAINPAMLAVTLAVGAAVAVFGTLAAKQQEAAKETDNAALAALREKDALEQLKLTAENYLTFMDDMSLQQQQASIETFSNTVVARTEKNLAAARAKAAAAEKALAATPRQIAGGLQGDAFSGYTQRMIANPEYDKALSAAEQARKELEFAEYLSDRVKIQLDAAQGKVNAVKGKIGQFTTEWSDKLAEDAGSAIERITAQETKDITKLQKNAEKTFGEGWKKNKEYEAAYQREATALHEYYSKKRTAQTEKEADAARKAYEAVSKWIGKGGSTPFEKLQNEYAGIEKERERALAELDRNAKALWADEFETQEDYIIALADLNAYYDDELHQNRLAQIDEYNSRFSKMLQEIDLETVQAINEKNLSAAAGGAAVSSGLKKIQSTDIGSVVSGFMSGGSTGAVSALVGTFTTALASACEELENVNKVFSFCSVIVGEIMEIVGETINDCFEPLIPLLEAIGTVIGKMAKVMLTWINITLHLFPVIQIVTAVIEAIGNVFSGILLVLTPILNGLTRLYNDYIAKFLAFLGLSVKKMKEIGESTDEAAAAAEKQAELLKKRYQHQMNTVNDMLNAQLSSLKTQYELGLITRDAYNEQAEQYAVEAEDKLYDLEKEMNDKLGVIESQTEDIVIEVNTLGSYFRNFWSWCKDGFNYWTDKIGGFFKNFWKDLIDSIARAIKSVGNGMKNTASSLWDSITGFFKRFADGTDEIPYDMPAVVHKGETIVPRTFAEGIRSGKLALVGGNSRASSGSNVYSIQLTVQGSVVTEKEITDVVYNGISRAIRAGNKAPLPMSA